MRTRDGQPDASARICPSGRAAIRSGMADGRSTRTRTVAPAAAPMSAASARLTNASRAPGPPGRPGRWNARTGRPRRRPARATRGGRSPVRDRPCTTTIGADRRRTTARMPDRASDVVGQRFAEEAARHDARSAGRGAGGRDRAGCRAPSRRRAARRRAPRPPSPRRRSTARFVRQ